MSQQLLGFIDSTKTWQADLIDSLHRNNWRPDSENDIQMFASQLMNGAEIERERFYQLRIYHLLRFTEIEERHETIAEAYKRTFEWVFHSDRPDFYTNCLSPNVAAKEYAPRWDSLTDWLCRGDSIYWITGKPGSGKSTLMKYLYNEERTVNRIKQWSGDHELITAGFFFWNSGTTMQMSRMGLLQSLLYQCATDRPELIPHIFPMRWQNNLLYGGDLHPWTWVELTTAFKALISIGSLRFLLFVDGLDEFDGDSSELASFILELTEISPNTAKLCVASRPWLVFEEAFGHMPWLRLEDLTRPDIRFYVEEKLRGSPRWRDLQNFMPDASSELITEVTDKASGVFLWVILVVESLLGGLRDGDSIDDLWNRLNSLPSTLEELFHKILGHLNPEYFIQACELFQLVQAAIGPLTLLDLSFVQDGYQAAMQAEAAPLRQEEITFRGETMRRRLLSRCKGLLEAPDAQTDKERAKVQYLHRTVRDFFQSPGVWEYVRSGASQFDPVAGLCGSFLRQAKVTRLRPDGATFEEFWEPFLKCIDYAKKGEEISGEAPIAFLDEVERAGDAYWNQPGSRPDIYESWLAELISLSITRTQNDRWLRVVNSAQREARAVRTTELQDALLSYAPKANKEIQKSIAAPGGHMLQVRKVTPHWINTACLAGGYYERASSGLSNSLFDYLFMLQFNSYVAAKLDRQLASHHRINGAHLIVHSLEMRDFAMVRLLIEHSANPNTNYNRHETAWDRLLEYAKDCPSYTPEKREELYSLVDFFLDNGADAKVTVINQGDGVVFLPLEKSLEMFFASLGRERTDALVMKVKTAKKKQKYSSGFRKAMKEKFHIRSFSKG